MALFFRHLYGLKAQMRSATMSRHHVFTEQGPSEGPFGDLAAMLGDAKICPGRMDRPQRCSGDFE